MIDRELKKKSCSPITDEEISQYKSERADSEVSHPGVAGAIATAVHKTVILEGSRFIAGSYVVTDLKPVIDEHPGILGHEYVHVHDAGNNNGKVIRLEQPDDRQDAWQEFRAYYASRVLFENDGVDSGAAELSAKVDDIHLEFGLEWPFEADSMPLEVIKLQKELLLPTDVLKM